MSVLFRARVSSFLAGLGVATVACMYQLKHDIDQSYAIVLDAMKEETKSLKSRVSVLEQRAGLSQEA